jgi:hypothetical protein
MDNTKLIDKREATIIGIQLSSDGKIWICIDGICTVRIIKLETVQIDLPEKSIRLDWNDGAWLEKK